MAWTWDRERKRYRNSTTGRFIAQKQVLAWRDLYVDLRVGSTQVLTKDMIDKTISRQAWERGMQEQVSKDFTTLYMFGRGGKDAMTPADTARLERMIRQQNRYLQGFSRDIRRGQVSPAQALARSRMYIGAGTQAFETGRAAAFGLPDLSQYPGDGQTRCLSNCQCHLSYHQDGSNWLVYWNLGVAEHCPDCEALATDWNPLTIGATGERRPSVPSWSGRSGEREAIPVSRQTGEALARWERGLSKRQYDALREYHDDSRPFQEALLKGGRRYRRMRAKIEAVTSALETAPRYANVLWRGWRDPLRKGAELVNHWKRAVGTRLDWTTFASSINYPGVAEGYGLAAKPLVFELRGVSGRVSRFYGDPKDRGVEVIFPPGTSWRVESVDPDMYVYSEWAESRLKVILVTLAEVL